MRPSGPAAIEGAPQVDGIEYVAVDVTDPEQVQAAVDTAAGAGVPLRTVVNCAGIGPSMRILGKKGPHDLGLYAKIIQVNLIGSFNVLTLAAEKIAQTEALEHGARGIIINTASIAAWEGQIGQTAYAASKGGVVQMTKALATAWAPDNIQVNAILPGWIDSLPATEERRSSVPMARYGTSDEIAATVAFLCSEGAGYITGQSIRIDGGLMRSV